MKTLALTLAALTALLPAGSARTVNRPFQIAEIRPGDQVFCEVVVKSGDKDTTVEGYALVVGINSERSLKGIREGVVKAATAKGAELCQVVSGTVNQDRSGTKAVWELIGLKDKPEGTWRVELPDDMTFKKAVRVKVQLVALADGAWVEKSRPLEKTLKPPARSADKR